MTIEELYGLFLRAGGRLTTDSRTINGGELFLALKGENFDGNEYAVKALEDGASAAIVSEGSQAASASRCIAVPDTYATLKELAIYHRLHCKGQEHLPVIGLTGTNGKTTTKELINCVLSTRYKVTATKGNFNNDIGVPLSLLSITPDTDIAIIEMGANHPDDIAHLVEISRPDMGLITNVGKAHLLGFGSFEGVKRAKGQLYDWLQAHGGKAFVNAGDTDLSAMASQREGLETQYYSMEAEGIAILPPTPECPFLAMEKDGKRYETSLVGTYNASNALAAIAIGRQFGISADEALSAICAFVPSNNRSQMVRTERNTLVVDAYNANPSSMAAALDNFSQMEAPHKLLLLGDMGELGIDSMREHVAILRRIMLSHMDAMLVGRNFENAAMSEASEIKCFGSSGELADYLEENPVAGATILIKGSRSMQMEKVISKL